MVAVIENGAPQPKRRHVLQRQLHEMNLTVGTMATRRHRMMDLSTRPRIPSALASLVTREWSHIVPYQIGTGEVTDRTSVEEGYPTYLDPVTIRQTFWVLYDEDLEEVAENFVETL